MGQCKRRIYCRQYESLTFKLTGKVLNNGYLWFKEILAIYGHFLPILTTLDINLGNGNFIEYFYKVHVCGTVEILMILNSLASEFVLEMQEESCRHILVRAALVEHLKDAFALIDFRLGADGGMCADKGGQSYGDY